MNSDAKRLLKWALGYVPRFGDDDYGREPQRYREALALLAAPSTPEPSGPVAALLRAASPDRHNTIDFGPPPKSPFLVVHGDVPEETIRAIRDAVLAALRAAPSTEPALDVERLARALRDHCHDSADEGPPIFLRHAHIAPFLTDACAPAIARRYARLAEFQS